MTNHADTRTAVWGRLGSADGYGVVVMEHRYPAVAAELWAALTDQSRLAEWLGDFRGDLRLGGEYRAHFFASGAEGSGRVSVCEPTRRLVLATTEIEDEGAQTDDLTLTPDGDHTTLTVEQRGLPLDLVAAYGAGLQIHLEDLAAHLDGRGRCDSDTRMGELYPIYQQLPVAEHGQ